MSLRADGPLFRERSDPLSLLVGFGHDQTTLLGDQTPGLVGRVAGSHQQGGRNQRRSPEALAAMDRNPPPGASIIAEAIDDRLKGGLARGGPTILYRGPHEREAGA